MNQFAKRVYTIAGVYGLIVMLPQYFLEDKIGRDYPPPITHPEYFCGFVGLTIVWQLAFLLIARDPARYRPLMLITVLEKLAFSIPAMLLYRSGRVAAPVAFFGGIDLVLGVLFVMAYMRTTQTGSN